MHRFTRQLLTAGALVLAGSATASSQASTDSLSPGSHVRASVRGQNVMLSGFVRDVRDDTLLIADCRKCANTTRTPIANLTSLELERRRSAATPGSVAGGAIAGLFVGTLAGVGVGALWVAGYHFSHTREQCGDMCGLEWLAVPIAGVIGGGAGIVTGGIVGLSRRESYWVRVTLPVPTR